MLRYLPKKLKGMCWGLTLAMLFFFSVSAYPREIVFGCLPSKVMMLEQLKSGYAYFSTAIYNKHAVIQLYINREGEWRIMGVDNDLTSCVLMQGTDWTFAIPIGI